MMDMFEFAMNMEKDGEAFYRQLADKSTDPQLTRLLEKMANEEVEHYKVVKKMKEGAVVELPPADALAGAPNVFAQMKKEEWAVNRMSSQIELYEKARETERKSEAFYAENAKKVEHAAQEEILLQLAKQEHQHYVLLDNLIEFLSRPQSWLENAEWRNVEEY
jgi:rubrerythrin